MSNITFKGKGITKLFKEKGSSFYIGPIDITLKLGRITAVVGANGSGKTTLLRIIAGILARDGGELDYPALDIWGRASVRDIKRQIGFLSQPLPQRQGLISENLQLSAALHGFKGSQNKDQVDFIIHRLSLEDYREFSWDVLSEGYKTRFELARLLVWHPKLLVLDEPLANLDIMTQALFLQDLRDLVDSASYPIAAIMSSQLLHEVEDIADEIVFLRNGIPIYNGPTSEIGQGRGSNVFEICCNASLEKLNVIFTKAKFVQMYRHGPNVIVITPLDFGVNEIMQIFIKENVSTKYIRDISRSSRMFFMENRSAF